MIKLPAADTASTAARMVALETFGDFVAVLRYAAPIPSKPSLFHAFTALMLISVRAINSIRAVTKTGSPSPVTPLATIVTFTMEFALFRRARTVTI